MVRNALIQIISTAIKDLVEKQVLDQSVANISVEIEPPKQADHGDFATNFCLVASKSAKTNPRALAETLLPAILQANLAVTRWPGVSGAQPGNALIEGQSESSHTKTGESLPQTRSGGQRGVDENDHATGEASAQSSPSHGQGRGRGGVDETSDSLPKPGEGQGGVDETTNTTGETGVQSSASHGQGRGWGGVAATTTAIASAEIAGPGFINFKLNPAWAAQFINEVLAEPDAFYKPQNNTPKKINVEHVSVNPNGPITIGSGRGAAFGSALCNVLEAAGNTVHREYYINDGVNSEQMRLFAESVKAIIEGRPVPDNGYKGDYVHEVAEKLRRLKGSNLDDIRLACQNEMIQIQNEALTTFQTNFDTWFSEQSLHDSGEVEKELDHLIQSGVADDKPIRTKVVFAKGGVIKEVLKEEQPTDEDDSDTVEMSLPDDRGGIKGGVDETQGHGWPGVSEAQPGNDEIECATTETSMPLPPGEGQREGQPANKTIWLRSTKFGDDQDRVLKRKDGRLTYIASDVAYHKDKFNRPANGDKLITVLGPDHHGYIARLTAVVAAMFSDQVKPLANPEPLSEHEALIYDSVEDRNQCQAALAWAKEHLEVQIFQIVRFLKDGKPAPMRKRDGNIYALIDLVNEIGETLRPNGTESEKQQAGSDVARFFYLMRHHDTAMDFDLELATKQSDENPVFYVQYAHARICSVIDKASQTFPPQDWGGQGGVDENTDAIGKASGSDSSLPRSGEGWGGVDLALLQHPKELALILKICDLQNEVARTAEDYSVNRLTTYSIELARTYHGFYDSCRVIQTDQPELSQARLALCHATRLALQAALQLLGVSAPNRMERSTPSS